MRSFNTQGVRYITIKADGFVYEPGPERLYIFFTASILCQRTHFVSEYKVYDKGVNKYAVEPFDYKIDKGDRIILTRYSTSDVYFDTDIRNHCGVLPSGYKYSYAVSDGYIAIDNKTVGEVMMLRDDTSGYKPGFHDKYDRGQNNIS